MKIFFRRLADNPGSFGANGRGWFGSGWSDCGNRFHDLQTGFESCQRFLEQRLFSVRARIKVRRPRFTTFRSGLRSRKPLPFVGQFARVGGMLLQFGERQLLQCWRLASDNECQFWFGAKAADFVKGQGHQTAPEKLVEPMDVKSRTCGQRIITHFAIAIP